MHDPTPSTPDDVPAQAARVTQAREALAEGVDLHVELAVRLGITLVALSRSETALAEALRAVQGAKTGVAWALAYVEASR